MMRPSRILRLLLVAGCSAVIAYVAVWLLFSLRPAAAGEPRDFKVVAGSGFRGISQALRDEGFIRSKKAFEIYAFLSGQARNLKPGHYQISPAYSGAKIAAILEAGPESETQVTMPEGVTVIDIDRILSEAGVTSLGEFLDYVKLQDRPSEGYLFPETYRFYFDSDPKLVLEKMLAEFARRAQPLLDRDPQNFTRNLILASILEREVPDQKERQIVAGILLKRAKVGMPLQVDAGLCYAKQQAAPETPCHPLTKLDKQIDSAYNTYSNSGWPPGPISNPGVLAIEAALQPKDSPYWYYISDPKSGRTIFAKTIEEQVMNQLKYLNND